MSPAEPLATRPSAPSVTVYADREQLAAAVAARLLLATGDALAARGRAHLVLTGGGIGGSCLAAVAASPLCAAVDWSRVHLWWGDERFLPAGNSERNATQARGQLIDTLDIPAAQVHEIAGPDRAADPGAAAADYTEALAAAAAADASAGQLPGFDVVLLGIGPEGHIASLFPQAAGLAASEPAIAVLDSPKPPPQRVSLTLPALSAGAEVWILAAGAQKAEAIARALSGAPAAQAPAAGVHGRLMTRFLLDRDAAGR